MPSQEIPDKEEKDREALLAMHQEQLKSIGIGDLLKFQKYLSKVNPSSIPVILDLLAKGEAMLNTPEGKAFIEAVKKAAKELL